MNRTAVAAAVAALVASLATGYAAFRYGMREGTRLAAPAAASSAPAADPLSGRRILYWHDPMVPGQRFDKPGKSPFMDMELVPVYADDAAGDEGVVAISPRVVQSLGIRTAEVVRGALTRQVQVVGNVAYNERELVLVQARVAGFVEKLHVRAPLDPVREGEPLVEILAPEWVAAQEEYLALRRLRTPDAESLRAAARQRMQLVGMGEEAIVALERTGEVRAHAVLTAPVSGVVAELGVREGMNVAAGATLFRINSLASVWINAEVPEAQAAMLRSGRPVEARAAAWPGVTFKGRIQSLLPQVNPITRTVTARAELANPNGRLAPGMFVTVDLGSVAIPHALLVPSEAVIQTGRRSVVIAALGEGRFRPVEVETGAEANGLTEIRKGLESGQNVVVSGQFLIDSEASLKATGARMEGAPAPKVHQAEGEIVSLTSREILIRHGDVPSAGMGAMTMPFLVSGVALPPGLKKGDRVRFEFSIRPDAQYQIVRVAPAGTDEHGAHR
jgi:Cu(I)/Ag(I) efflux system membrane fusion protein